MVQEQETDLGLKVAALERRIKDLERLLKLGLVGGGDVEATLQQHTALLGMLIGDATLGNVLTGPFPGVNSSMSLRRPSVLEYPSGTLNSAIESVAGLTLSANVIYASPFHNPDRRYLIDRMEMELTGAAGTADFIRFGAYTSDDDLYPQERVFSTVNLLISPLGAGFRALQVRESIPRGLIWLVLILDGTADIRPVPGAANYGGWALLGWDNASSIIFTGWTVAQAFGELPARFPSGGTAVTQPPVIWTRLVKGAWS